MREHKNWIGPAIALIICVCCLTPTALGQNRANGASPTNRSARVAPAVATQRAATVQRAAAIQSAQSAPAGAASVLTAQRTPVTADDGSQVIPASACQCAAPMCDGMSCGTMAGGLPGLATMANSRLWAYFEYLMWWQQQGDLPALATTSTTGTARDDAGVLGLDSTSVLFGGDRTDDAGMLSGGRLTIGFWIDPCETTGFFGRGFAMEEQSASFAADSSSSPILGRPFFNSFTDEPDALLLSFPEELSGSMTIDTETQTHGAQALLRRMFRQGGNYRIDLVGGYRYLAISDNLSIQNSLEFIDPSSAAFGTTIQQTDLFDLENEFHGADVGIMGHSIDGRWTLDFLATVALGSMAQRATMQGSTVTTPPTGTPFTAAGGLLTQQSNIGSFEENPFTVIPELTVTMGYFVTPRVDLSVGYTFLYVNHVARVGDRVDTSVNLTQQTGQLDGPARPQVLTNDSDFWLQGLNFGLNFRY